MLSSHLRPLRKLVLAARTVHLTLQAYHFPSEACLFLHPFRGRSGEFVEERP